MGHGEDLEDDYMALGWLNPLPPQAGIPGWQRITFMKHFNEDLNDPMEDNLWAYEGVVLPGGRIILGRWWFASEPNVSDAIVLSTLNAAIVLCENIHGPISGSRCTTRAHTFERYIY